MRSWEDTYVAWLHEEPFAGAGKASRGRRADQPAFRRCAWQHGLRVFVLAPEYNFRLGYPTAVVERVRVIHGGHPDHEGLAAARQRASAAAYLAAAAVAARESHETGAESPHFPGAGEHETPGVARCGAARRTRIAPARRARRTPAPSALITISPHARHNLRTISAMWVRCWDLTCFCVCVAWGHRDCCFGSWRIRARLWRVAECRGRSVLQRTRGQRLDDESDGAHDEGCARPAWRDACDAPDARGRADVAAARRRPRTRRDRAQLYLDVDEARRRDLAGAAVAAAGGRTSNRVRRYRQCRPALPRQRLRWRL